MEPRRRPGNTPLNFYRNSDCGFSMLYPDWWHVFDGGLPPIAEVIGLDDAVAVAAGRPMEGHDAG